jgi:cytosine deaminase
LLPPDKMEAMAQSLADSGIAVTVLPATDLFLMGRQQTHAVCRGVADAHVLGRHGVTCSLSTNNVLNPATPFGDCSLIRIANLYANVLQLDRPAELRNCFEMLTERSARLLNFKDYGFKVGNPADVVIINAETPEQAVAEIQERQADDSVGIAETDAAVSLRADITLFNPWRDAGVIGPPFPAAGSSRIRLRGHPS